MSISVRITFRERNRKDEFIDPLISILGDNEDEVIIINNGFSDYIYKISEVISISFGIVERENEK